MASKGQSGLGFALSIGAQTPTTGIPGADTYVLIGDSMESPINLGEWKTQNVTNFQSTTEEMNPTIQGVGTVPVKGNRVSTDAGQIVCMTAYGNGLAYDFKAVFPVNKKAGQTTTGDNYVFSAYVLSYKINAVTPEGIITFEMNLQIIGTPAYTQGS